MNTQPFPSRTESTDYRANDPSRSGAGGGVADANDSLGAMPNGPGAAAILGAGIGSLALGVFAFTGDASPTVLKAFNFWAPTGPLSGVTLTAVIVWLVAWYGLSRWWATRNVNLLYVNIASFVMLGAGLLLTFPPFMDLLQGK